MTCDSTKFLKIAKILLIFLYFPVKMKTEQYPPKSPKPGFKRVRVEHKISNPTLKKEALLQECQQTTTLKEQGPSTPGYI